jgi:hypothetical protein
MPEVWFIDEEKERLRGNIVKKRFEKNCTLCKKKQGAVM